MMLAERLHMTVAQLNREMSHAEFQMWMAYDSIRAEECPSCGHRADALMDVETVKVRCPICEYEYQRSRPMGQPKWH